MILQTPRLTLRHFTSDDGEFYCRLVNQTSWIANIGDRNLHSTDEAAERIRDVMIPPYTTIGYGMYVVELTATGTPVGVCGLVTRAELPHPDLGFALLEEHWGRGYAEEASRAMMSYAEALGLQQLLAILTATNERSKRLLDRLGFAPTGTIAMKGETLLLYSATLRCKREREV